AEFFSSVDEHLSALYDICVFVPYAAALVVIAQPTGTVQPAGAAQAPEAVQSSGSAAQAAQAAGAVQAVQPAQAPRAAGTVYERPAARHTETRPWVMLASFGMGAGVALAGAAVGWLFGRGWRRDA
ncbi:hypothetical protein AB0J43_56185, partial [Nonomuraea fuscirosea]